MWFKSLLLYVQPTQVLWKWRSNWSQELGVICGHWACFPLSFFPFESLTQQKLACWSKSCFLNRNLVLILAYVNKTIQPTKLFVYGCTVQSYKYWSLNALKKPMRRSLVLACRKCACLSKIVYLPLILRLCQSNRMALGMAASHSLLSLLIWQLGYGYVFSDKYTFGERCDI